jgi:hypothetical protein
MVSELFNQDAWKEVEGFGFTDVTYHRAVNQGTVRTAAVACCFTDLGALLPRASARVRSHGSRRSHDWKDGSGLL